MVMSRAVGSVAVLLLCLVGDLSAQSVDRALVEAIAGRDKAAVVRDVAGVDRYTADDYFAVNPAGALNNKAQRLAGLKVPANPQAAPQQPAVSEAVRIYGSVAVARQLTNGNRQLFVWVKNKVGWQAAAIHVVPYAFPPAVPPLPRAKTPQPSTLTPPTGLTGERAAVFAVSKSIEDAFFSGDRAMYQRHTAPEFVRIGPGAIVRVGAEMLQQVDGPRTQSSYSNIAVQVWDQVGMVRWLATNASGNQQWLTRILVKKESGWQQVATASSPAAKVPVAP